jgi:long-subunit acyl-CoA synthetase (AMP-forming)
MHRLGAKEVGIAYGMTETSPVSCQTLIADDVERRTRTVGRAHPHVQVRVVDATSGVVVDRGQEGELQTKGYSVMLGYWGDDKKTRECISSDGWMATGDVAVMRDDGYVSIVGRIKDMIIRGGENVRCVGSLSNFISSSKTVVVPAKLKKFFTRTPLSWKLTSSAYLMRFTASRSWPGSAGTMAPATLQAPKAS